MPVEEGPDGWASADDLDRIAADIDGWFAEMSAENPVLDLAERTQPASDRRWYVRIIGDDKDRTTIWFHLTQRSLHFEANVIPAPQEDHARFYEYFLRRSFTAYGMAFAIGPEDAIYLVGHVPLAHVSQATVDRIVGTVWQYVEETFRPALRIGFAAALAKREAAQNEG